MSHDELDDNSGDTSWIRGSGRSGDSSWIRQAPSSAQRRDSLTVKNVASSMKKNSTKFSPNNSYNLGGNNNKSVSFAAGTNMMDSATSLIDDSGGPGGPSRVAAAKAKLRNSFTASSLASASKGGASFTAINEMDQSWGGALMESIQDLSNSSDSDDSLGDSLGELMLDKSENFRSRAQQSVSFNMSFMNVGVDDDDQLPSGPLTEKSGMGNSSRRRRNTGRGSIFVIADEKFGNTKVVQTRLEKAAKKLQKFFRRCLLVLRQYNKELDYLRNELKDIEYRRTEELSDVVQYIKEEKEQFLMELEHEYSANQWTPEEWDAFHKEQEELKAEIARLKDENETFKSDCKKLDHENQKLAIVDPEKGAEMTRLELQIRKLERDVDDWGRIAANYRDAGIEAQRKIDLLVDKRKEKRAERKRIEKCIEKIIKLLEEHPTEASENPKVLEKVQKLKAKREKKLKNLKAKTVQQLAGISENDDAETPVGVDVEREREHRKDRRRRSRKDDNDDMPDLLPSLETNDQERTADHEAEGEKTAKKKKDKEKKKEKEKKKDKEKKEEAVTRTIDDEETLMILKKAVEKEEAKKNEKKKKSTKDNEKPPPQHTGALMALFT